MRRGALGILALLVVWEILGRAVKEARLGRCLITSGEGPNCASSYPMAHGVTTSTSKDQKVRAAMMDTAAAFNLFSRLARMVWCQRPQRMTPRLITRCWRMALGEMSITYCANKRWMRRQPS